MLWYHKTQEVNGREVTLEGTFSDSQLKITAFIPKGNCISENVLYEKTINMWAYQDVYAEDIRRKYQGMVVKCEKRLSGLVEKIEIEESL